MFVLRLGALVGGLSLFLASAIAAPAEAPAFDFKFTCNINPDVIGARTFPVPEGTRTSLAILGGNWTTPDGVVFANVIPSVGAETGYIGNDGIYRADVRYIVQFTSDNTFGFAQFSGFGQYGGANKFVLTVETNSTTHSDLNAKFFYGPGSFVGTTLVIQHWTLD